MGTVHRVLRLDLGVQSVAVATASPLPARQAVSYLDGYHQWRLPFNDRATLEMLMTLVPFDKTDSLLAGRRLVLEQSYGVMLLPGTFAGRPEYFD